MASERAKTIWPRVPNARVKGQLLAHKLLGLPLAALMYLVCLTGTIAVFYTDYERWERPGNPEMSSVAPEAVGRALATARARIATEKDKPANVYVILPSQEIPRLSVDYGTEALAFDEAGRLAGSSEHELTHFLLALHYALGLPYRIGFIVVGTLGVLLVALIVGGSLALPRIFRDAFRLRLEGGQRLSRTDMHNRLAVWGLPFHLAVAVSGAFIGLGALALALAQPIQFGGDAARAAAIVYGDPAAVAARARLGGPPALEVPEARLVSALQTLARERAHNQPLFITVGAFGTPDETLSIGAAHNDRLIYSETYRFDSAGGLLDTEGYADGSSGRQLQVSMFRLHVGGFGGYGVKLAYVVLGLALCFLCTTGIDIWLAKAAARGRAYPRFHAAWTSFVWATPVFLALACIAHMLLGLEPFLVFWVAVTLASFAGIWIPQRVIMWSGPLAAGISVVLLVIVHMMVHGAEALTPGALAVNGGLLATGLVLLLVGERNRRKQTARAPAPAGAFLAEMA